MTFTYSFEKLDVWQASRIVVKEIYKITETIPETEKFGLVSQIRSAAISVSSNLAEGSSRKTLKEQARFTQISFSSLMEVLNQLILASDLNFIDNAVIEGKRPSIKTLPKQLNNLYNSQISPSTFYKPYQLLYQPINPFINFFINRLLC